MWSPSVMSITDPPSEQIAVVQALRPAVPGGPEGPHYIRSDLFTRK